MSVGTSLAFPCAQAVSLDVGLTLYKRTSMNLTIAARVLMGQIDDLAKKVGFLAARVDVKVNAHGELVIAVLIPPRTPDEWGPPSTFDRREAARLARQQRS
jgi:hypothetical protein